MRRLPVGLRDVRVAMGVVVGMLLAGVLLPLASPDQEVTTAGGRTGPSALRSVDGDLTNVGDSTATSEASVDGATGPGAEGGTAASGNGSAPAAGVVAIGGGDSAGAGAERTASDQGVTESTVKIGVALMNLDNVNRAGVAATNGSVAERTRVWEALVAAANGRGGAAGRTIEAVFAGYDPLDRNASQQVCRRFAEDDKVFAVFSDPGWTNQAALCVTRQYQLPNIAYDAQDIAVFDQAGGLLFTGLATNDRMVYNHVHALERYGVLKGKTIGMVIYEGISTAPERTEIPALEAMGYRVTHKTVLSSDIPTAQSQIPIEINQMRSKGVDLILWDGSSIYSNLWLSQAQRSGYNPTYSFSEFNSVGDDFGIQTISQQIDGYSWGSRRRLERRTDRPEAPSDAACVNTARQATGFEIARSSDLYWETVRYCGELTAFADAMQAAGPNPTRPTFATALSNLGQRPDLEQGPPGVGGTWGPGKPDAADHLHMMRHDVSCRCWRPQGDWFPMIPLGG